MWKMCLLNVIKSEIVILCNIKWNNLYKFIHTNKFPYNIYYYYVNIVEGNYFKIVFFFLNNVKYKIETLFYVFSKYNIFSYKVYQ